MVSRKEKKEPKYVSEWKYKRNLKSVHMWIEQILLRISRLEEELKELKETVKLIRDDLDKILSGKDA